MPIYIYQCESCGIRFERFQGFQEQPLTRCPECQKNTLRKVYQPVGIVFKGSGFYSTDNRSPSGSTRRDNKSKEGNKQSTDSSVSSSKSDIDD